MSTIHHELLLRDSSKFSFLPLSLDDTKLYLTWFTSEKVRTNLDPSTPRTFDEITDWVHDKTSREDIKYYIIRHDGKPIGHAGVKNIDQQAHSAELSCVIGDEDSLGTGVGLTAMVKFFDFVFSNFNFDSIYIARLKGTSGANFFSSLGFTLSHNQTDDIYTLTRPQYNELKLKIAS